MEQSNDNYNAQPPTVIPIHSISDDLPQWALIEINGEILPPKEISKDGNHLECELGSIWFEEDSVRLIS